MSLKTKSISRHSIGESNFKKHIYSLGNFIYNRNNGEIFGRNAKRWSKLAAFYFFFYIALGGFFCLYLSIFMSFLPLNQPRYIGKDSQLTSRANPLSPGLSFRPQISSKLNDKQAVISLSLNNGRHRKRSNDNDNQIENYIKNLDEFLNVYYSIPSSMNFTINDVNDCHSDKQYGYRDGRPCILIKINKLVGFTPEIGRTDIDNRNEPVCVNISNIPVQCRGENAVDKDMLGDVMYYSEFGTSNICGSFDIKHFPYNGKNNQNVIYQSPFVWVQFTNLTPDVFISVECRIFGGNIFYDKIAQRASIRFQLYLNKNM